MRLLEGGDVLLHQLTDAGKWHPLPTDEIHAPLARVCGVSGIPERRQWLLTRAQLHPQILKVVELPAVRQEFTLQALEDYRQRLLEPRIVLTGVAAPHPPLLGPIGAAANPHFEAAIADLV